MVSKSFTEKELKNAAGDHGIQVGWRASEMLVRFLWAVAKAVAKQTLEEFRQRNTAFERRGLKPRKRLDEEPVCKAIRKVLAQPETHLPKWFSRRPPRPPRK